MLELCELTIDDKAIFHNYFLKYSPNISELNFTNLFIWRKFYNFRYTLIDNCLCIIAFPIGGEPFAFSPIGFTCDNIEKVILKLKTFFNSSNKSFVLKRVDEKLLPCFRDLGSMATEIIFDRDNSDYIYDTNDLINLNGRKYSAKRNHIKHFISQYEFEYLEYDPKYYDQCLILMEQMISEHEKISNFELLNYYHKLDCKCSIIKIKENVVAITVGEKITDDTAVIHIEKADRNINGLYSFINQKFCESEWSSFKYINREQDLGIEGIRKAKSSYHPIKILSKYIIKIN